MKSFAFSMSVLATRSAPPLVESIVLAAAGDLQRPAGRGARGRERLVVSMLRPPKFKMLQRVAVAALEDDARARAVLATLVGVAHRGRAAGVGRRLTLPPPSLVSLMGPPRAPPHPPERPVISSARAIPVPEVAGVRDVARTAVEVESRSRRSPDDSPLAPVKVPIARALEVDSVARAVRRVDVVEGRTSGAGGRRHVGGGSARGADVPRCRRRRRSRCRRWRAGAPPGAAPEAVVRSRSVPDPSSSVSSCRSSAMLTPPTAEPVDDDRSKTLTVPRLVLRASRPRAPGLAMARSRSTVQSLRCRRCRAEPVDAAVAAVSTSSLETLNVPLVASSSSPAAEPAVPMSTDVDVGRSRRPASPEPPPMPPPVPWDRG